MYYQEIADELNDNVYSTQRGKTFRSAYSHSIFKKVTIRKKEQVLDSYQFLAI